MNNKGSGCVQVKRQLFKPALSYVDRELTFYS